MKIVHSFDISLRFVVFKINGDNTCNNDDSKQQPPPVNALEILMSEPGKLNELALHYFKQ